MNIKDNLTLMKYAAKFSVREKDGVLQIVEPYTKVAAEINVNDGKISYYVTGVYNYGSNWAEIDMNKLNRLKEFCEAIVGSDTECEIIRILQNALQLMKLYSRKADKMQEKAYEEFIKSLNRTDKDFMLKLAEIAKEESERK